MTTTTDDLVCDCIGFNSPHSADHEMICSLWDDDDFQYGNSWWDPDAQQLINIDDLEDADEAEIIELFANKDDKKPARIKNDLETVTDTRDILTVALQQLYGATSEQARDKEFRDKCFDIFPEHILWIFEDMSNQYDLTNKEFEQLDAFGRDQHANYPDDIDPYFCSCQLLQGNSNVDDPVIMCRACGVMAWNGLEGPMMVPMYERRVREVVMTLTGEFYECTHEGRKFVCKECKVAKWTEDGPWSYWNPLAAGDWVTRSEYKPTTKVDDVGDGWSGAGAYSASGWGGWGGGTFTMKCRHYGEVVPLPDGTNITCSSQFDRKGDKADIEPPALGCYFYSGWKPDWLYFDLPWTDYGLPKIPVEQVLMAAETCLNYAREGLKVEIGCMGGHGRTGTFLAILALYAGAADAKAAIDFVHTSYCEHAIEGIEQEWYVEFINARLKGLPIPPKPVKPCFLYEHRKLFDKGEVCDPQCDKANEHYLVWLEDLAKALALPPEAWEKKKPVTSTTSTSVKKVESTSPMTGTEYDQALKKISWATPDPGTTGDSNYCSLYRHSVLWWRHESCAVPGCAYWEADALKFKHDKQRQATTPRPLSQTPMGKPDMEWEHNQKVVGGAKSAKISEDITIEPPAEKLVVGGRVVDDVPIGEWGAYMDTLTNEEALTVLKYKFSLPSDFKFVRPEEMATKSVAAAATTNNNPEGDK